MLAEQPVTIVPPPCGRDFGVTHYVRLCRAEDRCGNCAALGHRLLSRPGTLCWWEVLAWNLTLAALCSAAAAREHAGPIVVRAAPPSPAQLAELRALVERGSSSRAPLFDAHPKQPPRRPAAGETWVSRNSGRAAQILECDGARVVYQLAGHQPWSTPLEIFLEHYAPSEPAP